MSTPGRTLLKRDLFGVVSHVASGPSSTPPCVERDTTAAAPWIRWLARRLAAREARALLRLRGLPGVPRLLAWDGRRLLRSWLPGTPLHRAANVEDPWFRDALRLLRRVHARGVVHNDLAKEPNWLVDAGGGAGLLDFQLALQPAVRGRLFRALAYDDLRHLLKHKRTYCPERLTARQRRVLARRSLLAAAWARTVKPAYRLVTRGLLGWADREGAGDRGAAQGSTVSKSSAGASPGRK
jgi:hypothetical protein